MAQDLDTLHIYPESGKPGQIFCKSSEARPATEDGESAEAPGTNVAMEVYLTYIVKKPDPPLNWCKDCLSCDDFEKQEGVFYLKNLKI